MRITIPLLLTGAIVGCGDDHAKTPDAAIDGPGVDAEEFDAMEPPLTLQNNEGGEIRAEWLLKNDGTTTGPTAARVTAFFHKTIDPVHSPLPSFPGCVDMRAKSTWPLAVPTSETPLDVGSVILHGSKTGSDLVLTKDATGLNGGTPTTDALGRPHKLWWKHDSNLPTDYANNDGDTMLAADQGFTVILTGSSEWPPQTFQGALGHGPYMPSNWGAPTDPPTTTATPLLADTDLVLHFSPDASTTLPAGYKVNTVVAFTSKNPGPDGIAINGPLVFCQFDGTPAQVTVPAAMVNIIRGYNGATGGAYSRIHLTHHLEELTDGSPRATADRKRIDMLTIWCYPTAWIAQ